MAVLTRSLFALSAVWVTTACSMQHTAESAMRSAPTVWLMGEVHDNPQAHQARYAIIADKVKQGWRPAIVMEQFDREHQITDCP